MTVIKNNSRLILIVLIIIAITEMEGFRSYFSINSVKGLFLENKFIGIILFCLVFSIGNLLYVPGWIFLVGSVFSLGKEWGGLVTYLAAMFSAIVSFYCLHYFGRDALRNFDNKLANRIFSNLDKNPISSIALLRLIFQTAPPLNYALAMSDIRFRNYLFGTLIGLHIPIFVYCYFFEFFLENVFK